MKPVIKDLIGCFRYHARRLIGFRRSETPHFKPAKGNGGQRHASAADAMRHEAAQATSAQGANKACSRKAAKSRQCLLERERTDITSNTWESRPALTDASRDQDACSRSPESNVVDHIRPVTIANVNVSTHPGETGPVAASPCRTSVRELQENLTPANCCRWTTFLPAPDGRWRSARSGLKYRCLNRSRAQAACVKRD